MCVSLEMTYVIAMGKSHVVPVLDLATLSVWRLQSSSKMAAPLEVGTREDECSLICFLAREGVNPSEIHRRMKMQHGAACVSLQQVYDWDKKFYKWSSFSLGVSSRHPPCRH